MQRELGELKQLSSRRKRDNVVISLVAASERKEAQTQIVFRSSGLIYQTVLIFKQINWGYGKSTDLWDQRVTICSCIRSRLERRVIESNNLVF